MRLILILLSTLASRVSCNDWIPGYLDENGILHTFHNKHNQQHTSESQTKSEKILLRIKFHKKTPNNSQVTSVVRKPHAVLMPGYELNDKTGKTLGPGLSSSAN